MIRCAKAYSDKLESSIIIDDIKYLYAVSLFDSEDKELSLYLCFCQNGWEAERIAAEINILLDDRMPQ